MKPNPIRNTEIKEYCFIPRAFDKCPNCIVNGDVRCGLHHRQLCTSDCYPIERPQICIDEVSETSSIIDQITMVPTPEIPNEEYLANRKPSRAVIANGSNGGAVLWYIGFDISTEIHECGLTDLGDLGLDDAPDGISIWEGYYVYEPDRYEDGDNSYPEGDFRSPTLEEWMSIQAGQPPWNEKEWGLVL